MAVKSTSIALLVLDHCPLQQGLRPFYGFLFLSIRYVLDHCPLQQGLRLFSINSISYRYTIVRDHLPLQ